MSIDIRLPNINAPTTEGQMAQMQSYMHQLVEQLNWALNTVSNAQSGNTSNIVIENSSKGISPAEAEDTFNSIKALIIKSADIVKAYEDKMVETFNGSYVAQSDFGTYLRDTKLTIESDSVGIEELFESQQKISGTVDGINDDIKNTNAYIKRGLLGPHERLGKDVYGIAVGQTDDNGAYKQYAWFISEGLCLFDENGSEVAYVSQNKLNITNAIFKGTVQFGDYRADTTDGLAFTWVGGV